MAEPRVWALLGQRPGDNNQVLALAEALGLPFEIKRLEYNHWRHLRPGLLGASLLSLTRQSREAVLQDPPDLTISTGIRSAPVVQWLRRTSHGHVRSVHIGYPRLSPGRFDLVVATPEYPISDHPNLRRVPFALTRHQGGEPRQPRLQYPSPRRLLVLGGPTLYWAFRNQTVMSALARLLERAQDQGGSVLVVASPRTPRATIGRIEQEIERATVPATFFPEGGPLSYRELLERADEIFVTADSVAMISDALVTGKPVGTVPIERSVLGRIYLALMDRLRPGRRVHPRDLRFFWRTLEEQKLAGTLDEPCSNAHIPVLTAEIAAEVRSMLQLDEDDSGQGGTEREHE